MTSQPILAEPGKEWIKDNETNFDSARVILNLFSVRLKRIRGQLRREDESYQQHQHQQFCQLGH